MLSLELRSRNSLPAFKMPINRKLFFFSFKVCLKKYTFPKFEKSRRKIDDFTSLQICAFLPSKIVFESHGQNTTRDQFLTSLWCHNRSRNMANKKGKRQRGWKSAKSAYFGIAGHVFLHILSLANKKFYSANKLMATK